MWEVGKRVNITRYRKILEGGIITKVSSRAFIVQGDSGRIYHFTKKGILRGDTDTVWCYATHAQLVN